MGLGGGGENSYLPPSFRRKGGAPVPLHPPSLATGLAGSLFTAPAGTD